MIKDDFSSQFIKNFPFDSFAMFLPVLRDCCSLQWVNFPGN